MIANRRYRGSILLGFSAVVIVVSAICMMMAVRCVETLQAAGNLEREFSARHAAEGALVNLENNGDFPINIGNFNINLSSEENVPSEFRLEWLPDPEINSYYFRIKTNNGKNKIWRIYK